MQVGGLGEVWELTWTHIQLSVAATAIATILALPLGLWLGHIGRYQFLATSTSNIGRAVPALRPRCTARPITTANHAMAAT